MKCGVCINANQLKTERVYGMIIDLHFCKVEQEPRSDSTSCRYHSKYIYFFAPKLLLLNSIIYIRLFGIIIIKFILSIYHHQIFHLDDSIYDLNHCYYHDERLLFFVLSGWNTAPCSGTNTCLLTWVANEFIHTR